MKYSLGLSEIYKKKSLLSHLIIDAYSLSAKIVYHLDAKRFPNNNPEVLTHEPAAPENQIETLIFIKYKN